MCRLDISGNHPARRTFQALRIEVNQIESPNRSATGRVAETRGRLCVISFHSLEDRIVRITLPESRDCLCPNNRFAPVDIRRSLKYNQKPVEASPAEVARNKRAEVPNCGWLVVEF